MRPTRHSAGLILGSATSDLLDFAHCLGSVEFPFAGFFGGGFYDRVTRIGIGLKSLAETINSGV